MTDESVQLEAVDARAELEVRSLDVTVQEGPNGVCSVIRVRGEGPMASDDPRLAGIFKADAVMLINERGEGVGRDDWEIVDAESGASKASGIAHSIHNDPGFQENPEPFYALSIGRFEDGSRLFTRARVSLPRPGRAEPIVIEYGGGPEPAHRGFAAAGRCDGLL